MSSNDITFVARLRDQITGPTQNVIQSLNQMGTQAQQAGQGAASAHQNAGQAASQHANATQQAASSIGQAFQHLESDAQQSAQAFQGAWNQASAGTQQVVQDLSSAGTQMISESQHIGQTVGGNLHQGIQGGIDNIDVSGLATALGGLSVGAGVMSSLDRDVEAHRAAASVAADPEQMRKLTEQVYGNNFGQDYDQVSNSALNIVGTLGIEPTDPQAEALLRGGVTMEEVFGLDAEMLTLAVNIMADTDDVSLVDAQKRIASTLQSAAPGARDEVLDNLVEYMPLLNDTGISAGVLATMLSGASGQGPMASDKTGDLMKEFTVRAVDTGSTSLNDAYSELGLDQAEISRRLQSGDATAFTDVNAALAGVTDQADQARLAIELFGTPIEDLGVGNIDDQVAAWSELNLNVSGTDDALAGMEENISEGPGNAWGQAMRDLSGAMIEVGDAAAPVISDIAPIISWLAKPLAWGATGLTLYGIMSRIPGLAGAASWALRGLLRVVALSPLGRFVTILGLAVSGLGELYDHNEKVRGAFDAVSDSIRDLIDLFDDLLGKADDWASKKLGLENNGGAAEAREMQEADIRPQWWKDAMRPVEETVGWGPQAKEGEGWLRIFQGSQDEEDLPHHADGGWTASGAHKAIVGEKGREFVVNNWASEKLASIPGAIPAISKGKLPVQGVPVAGGGAGGGGVSIGELHVHTSATDGADFARQFAAEFPKHYVAAKDQDERRQSLTYMTYNRRGAH